MTEPRWIKNGEPANAENLARALLDHILDENAHPELVQLLQDHINDPDAHGFRKLFEKYLMEHNTDDLAHEELVLYFLTVILMHDSSLDAHAKDFGYLFDKADAYFNLHLQNKLAHQWLRENLNTFKVGNSPPEPREGLVWVDTSVTPYTLKVYDGTQWVEVATAII